MPVTIYPTTLKYKNSNGQFQSATAIKGDSGAAITVQVEGTSPTIVCEDNHRYICGEVLSLNITLPDSGIIDVVFESGSTPTVLTITPPTGVTLKWANGFNPSNLDANTCYQIRITDGELCVANVYSEQNEQGGFELIASITLSDDNIKEVTIETDINGDPFELSKVYALYIPHTTAQAANLQLWLDSKKNNRRLAIAYKANVVVENWFGCFSSRDMGWTLFGGNYNGNGSVKDTYITVPNYNLDPIYRNDYIRAITFTQNVNFPVGSDFLIYGEKYKG